MTGLEIRALATSTARRDSNRASFSSSSDLVDVTRNDLQRRFLAEHSVAMLEQCCSYSKQCCNVVMRKKSSLRIVPCNITFDHLSPKIDQNQISPCNINALENRVVLRIMDMIKQDEFT